MKSLENRVAIITGASSGIGRASALLFAREGAKLVLNARGEGPLREVVAEIERAGGSAVAVAGDAGDEACAQTLVAQAERRFGGLDIAFNNVGTMGALQPLPELSLEQWQAALRTNLTSAFLAAKYQLPALLARGRGSLIFTSTFVGYSAGLPNTSAYAASKSGLIGLTQALAAEYGARNIRVNALLPGGTDTPMSRDFASSEEQRAAVRGLHALRRIAAPEEIAQSALYLASDAASFTTGTALLVDGGVSISRF